MSPRHATNHAATTIRAYAAGDEQALLRVWNASLYTDPINEATWRTKVLLDPNFAAEGCLVAECEGQVRGFLLSFTRQVPFYNDGLQAEQAWITAFGVHPDWQGRGLGSTLVQATLDHLGSLGCHVVSISPYVPGYFTPGVDVAAYGKGLEFLTQRGFEIISRPLSMQVDLSGWRSPAPITATAGRLAQEGIEVRPARACDIVPLLTFIRQYFSWDWHREASAVMGDLFAGDPRQVSLLIATLGERVVGYAQHRAERFGPFGVQPELRHRGIGRVLLAATLAEMQAKNYHVAWFLWTGDDAARLYAQCGFREVRRFAVLRKTL